MPSGASLLLGMTFTPISSVTAANPADYYALLSQQPFQYHADLRCWVAAKADHVEAVLNSNLCAVRPVAEPVPKALAGTQAGEIFRRLARMQDGEAHRALKKVIVSALQAIPDEEITQAAKASALDLLPTDLNRYAFALPIHALGRLLGFAPSDLPQLTALLQAFAPCLTPTSSAEVVQHAISVADQLWEFVSQHPLKLLDDLDADAATANRIGLLWQGYESTAGLILHGLLNAKDGVHHDWETFMLDTVRSAAPIQNTRRFIVQNGRLLGQDVQVGEVVLIVLAAANHGHKGAGYSFGAGSHACPGQRLALTIASEGVKAVLDAGLTIPPAIGFRPSLNARLPLIGGEGA